MKNKEIVDKIGEQIMGWEYLNVGYFGTEDETPRMTELKEWMDKNCLGSVGHYWIDEDNNFWRPCVEFKPLTNIAHAFEVVYEMEKKGFGFRLQHGNMVGNLWLAQFFYLTEPIGISGHPGFLEKADTPGNAICLAALETKKNK